MSRTVIRLDVEIQPHRFLDLFDPYGHGRIRIPGRTILHGSIKKIRGAEWIVFPLQRRYGLPRQRSEGRDAKRISLDLQRAELAGHVVVTETQKIAEETI